MSLMKAVMERDIDSVRSLLATIDDVDAPDDTMGYTCLYRAARDGYTEIVSLLLDKGADPNMPGYLEYTPLSIATLYDHVDTVGELLRRGADPRLDTSRSLAKRHAIKQMLEDRVSKLQREEMIEKVSSLFSIRSSSTESLFAS